MRKKDAARGKEGSSPHCAAGVISGALTELAAMGQAGGAPTNGNGSHGGLGMGHTVSHRRGVVAVAAMVVALLVWPVTSEAQLGDLTGTITGTTGTITGTTSTITGTLLGTTTVLGGTGTLVAGTSDALSASSLTGSVGSLVAGEVLRAVTIGYPDQIDSEASLAALALNLAGSSIGADSVMSRATAAAGGAYGISNIDGLAVNGIPIPVTGAPNQTIGIPGGVLIINEQQVGSDGTMVVNALHAVVSGVADVGVASAQAGLSGGRAQALQASY